MLTDQPVRTCIGCRKRVPASELLRFVAVESQAGTFRLVADAARKLPGRGAHLHPGPGCFALAQRRRAFGRSLRVTGVVDTGELAEALLSSGSGLAPSAVGQSAHPHPQGRTTNMSTP
ncbi:YlxR family protein [Virgisporangium ochraceum]|uniref:YlxR family protein n=1 Tax=Virgisporangium ochraceum TaxID=65505 RepID=UPI001EF256B1